MLASLVKRTPRQTELTAISRSTPDTTITATPTVTDREHDGWGGEVDGWELRLVCIQVEHTEQGNASL